MTGQLPPDMARRWMMDRAFAPGGAGVASHGRPGFIGGSQAESTSSDDEFDIVIKDEKSGAPKPGPREPWKPDVKSAEVLERMKCVEADIAKSELELAELHVLFAEKRAEEEAKKEKKHQRPAGKSKTTRSAQTTPKCNETARMKGWYQLSDWELGVTPSSRRNSMLLSSTRVWWDWGGTAPPAGLLVGDEVKALIALFNGYNHSGPKNDAADALELNLLFTPVALVMSCLNTMVVVSMGCRLEGGIRRSVALEHRHPDSALKLGYAPFPFVRTCRTLLLLAASTPSDPERTFSYPDSLKKMVERNPELLHQLQRLDQGDQNSKRWDRLLKSEKTIRSVSTTIDLVQGSHQDFALMYLANKEQDHWDCYDDHVEDKKALIAGHVCCNGLWGILEKALLTSPYFKDYDFCKCDPQNLGNNLRQTNNYSGSYILNRVSPLTLAVMCNHPRTAAVLMTQRGATLDLRSDCPWSDTPGSLGWLLWQAKINKTSFGPTLETLLKLQPSAILGADEGNEHPRKRILSLETEWSVVPLSIKERATLLLAAIQHDQFSALTLMVERNIQPEWRKVISGPSWSNNRDSKGHLLEWSHDDFLFKTSDQEDPNIPSFLECPQRGKRWTSTASVRRGGMLVVPHGFTLLQFALVVCDTPNPYVRFLLAHGAEPCHYSAKVSAHVIGAWAAAHPPLLLAVLRLEGTKAPACTPSNEPTTGDASVACSGKPLGVEQISNVLSSLVEAIRSVARSSCLLDAGTRGNQEVEQNVEVSATVTADALLNEEIEAAVLRLHKDYAWVDGLQAKQALLESLLVKGA